METVVSRGRCVRAPPLRLGPGGDPGWPAGRDGRAAHWLLARRSTSDPTEIAYYQVRTFRGGHAHITLSMLALAWLPPSAPANTKKGTTTEKEQFIAMTVPEPRRLIAKLLDQRHPNNEPTISWSGSAASPPD